MDSRFESLTIFEFQDRFPDDNSCEEYLSVLKWGKGYVCSKCGHTRYCFGSQTFSRQCTRCSHVESVTSGTLFHKVKFPLLKVSHIIYYVSTNKKGISSTELSRKLGLRQKTCWLFKQKVMRGMQSSHQHKLIGQVEVDETVVGGAEAGVNSPDLHRVIMGFKGWLRGIHHHAEHLQAYVDEYAYRFNRSFMKGNIFDNLILRMVKAKPYTYKMIIN